MERRQFLTSSLAASALTLANRTFSDVPSPLHPRNCDFQRTISRPVLDNYLSRAISMEGLLNGRGDLENDIRMLGQIGAKYIGRSICLWGGEGNLIQNLARAKQQLPMVHATDPEMILRGRNCSLESLLHSMR